MALAYSHQRTMTRTQTHLAATNRRTNIRAWTLNRLACDENEI